VDRCRELTPDDVAKIRKFLVFFESVFGRMRQDNRYMTNNWLACTMIIFMDNLQKTKDLLKRFDRKVVDDGTLRELGKYSNVMAYKSLYREIIERINYGGIQLNVRNISRTNGNGNHASETSDSDSDFKDDDDGTGAVTHILP